MRKLKIASILFLIILISACSNTTSELEFEKEVMQEIFPSIIDSIWINNKISFDRNILKYTKSGSLNKNSNKSREYYNQKLVEIKQDSSRIFVIISDKVFPFYEDQYILTKHFKTPIIIKNSNDTLDYEIDTSKFIQPKYLNIKFVSKSEKIDRFEVFNQHNYIDGVVSFSRIKFDAKKHYGILTVNSMIRLSGIGYTVFIKKENDKWLIDKLQEFIIN